EPIYVPHDSTPRRRIELRGALYPPAPGLPRKIRTWRSSTRLLSRQLPRTDCDRIYESFGPTKSHHIGAVDDFVGQRLCGFVFVDRADEQHVAVDVELPAMRLVSTEPHLDGQRCSPTTFE